MRVKEHVIDGVEVEIITLSWVRKHADIDTYHFSDNVVNFPGNKIPDCIVWLLGGSICLI